MMRSDRRGKRKLERKLRIGVQSEDDLAQGKNMSMTANAVVSVLVYGHCIIREIR